MRWRARGGGGGPPAGDTYTVDGVIKDHTGSDLEGATVSIPSSGTSSVTTDINGYYTIPNVP